MISNNLRLQRVLCLSILALTLAIVFFLFVHQNWEKIDEHINARLSGLKSSKAGVSKSNPPLDFGPNSGSNGSDKKKTSGGNFVIDTNSISGVDWKRFAYIQYVTDEVFLCNSVMIFESLNRLKSKADRLLMYPSQWEEDLNNNTDSFIVRMLKKSRDEYGARLRPVGVMDLGGDRTWDFSDWPMPKVYKSPREIIETV